MYKFLPKSWLRSAASAISGSVIALSIGLAHGQAVVPAAPAAPANSANSSAPDGSPALPKETTISQKSVTPSSELDSVVLSEERVEGRLASARVGGAANSYLIVDPNAGRTDRAASNSGKRVTPSQWQLFRF
ncbi:MAG: hypothetical protein EAZ43_14280 [Betaproteobacteria bacterium]|nr:MAG: hypothetical protein EAZ43_14280 [Betaproteobacteria bacterium]